MIITRDSVKTADDKPTKKIAVPEWGGDVFIKTLSGDERDGWESHLETHKKKGKVQKTAHIRASLVVISAVDEAGNLIFSEDDAEWLGEKSAKPISRLFDVAVELSGLKPEDVEGLEKNYGDDQKEPSG